MAHLRGRAKLAGRMIACRMLLHVSLLYGGLTYLVLLIMGAWAVVIGLGH